MLVRERTQMLISCHSHLHHHTHDEPVQAGPKMIQPSCCEIVFLFILFIPILITRHNDQMWLIY